MRKTARRAKQVHRAILENKLVHAFIDLEEVISDQLPVEQTLTKMVFPNNLNLRLMGITLPTTTENWEIKHSFIHIISWFSDMAEEDPQRYLQDFKMACCTICTLGNMDEYVQLVSFLFSLHDGAREWLYTLPTGSVIRWQRGVLLHDNNATKIHWEVLSCCPYSEHDENNQRHQNGHVGVILWLLGMFQAITSDSKSWLGWGHMRRHGSMPHVEDPSSMNF